MLLLWRSWLREVGDGAYTGRPSISACVSALDLAAASAAFFAAFSSSIFFSNSLAFSAAFVAFSRRSLQALRSQTLMPCATLPAPRKTQAMTYRAARAHAVITVDDL